MNNKYLESIKLESFPRHIAEYNSGFVSIVSCPWSIEQSGYTYSFFDENGKITGQKLKHDLSDFTGQELLALSTVYTVNDTVCYWEAYFDTIYGFTNEGQVIPRWTFNYGKNFLKKEEMKTMQALDKACRIRDYISSFIETPSHVFVQGTHARRQSNLILDKVNNEYINPKQKNINGGGQIVNDLDGIISYWAKFSPASNTTLAVLRPMTFKTAFEETEWTKENQQYYEKYKSHIEKISENDNPILCIVSHK